MVERLLEKRFSLAIALLCALALALVGMAAQPRDAWAGEGLESCGDYLRTEIGGGTYTLSIYKEGDPCYMYGWDGPDDSYCPWYDQREAIEAVELGDGVPNIGDYAFAECAYLKSVTIPSSLSTIGKNAFEGCTSLESITLPASVDTIRENAFAGCTNLKSVTVQGTNVNVEEDAFNGCPEDLVITGYAVKDAWEEGLPRYCNVNNVYFNALNGDLGTYTLDLVGKAPYFNLSNAAEEQEFSRISAVLNALYRVGLVDCDGMGKYDLDKDGSFDLDYVSENHDGHWCETFKVTASNSVKGSKTITIPKGIGRYIAASSDYDGFYYSAITFKMTKVAPTVKAKKATVKVKKAKVKKKAQTIANLTVTCDKGKASYKNVSKDKKAKKFKVNKKTGKVTVPKGTKKGTYKMKVKVTVKAGTYYTALTKTVSFKVKVK